MSGPVPAVGICVIQPFLFPFLSVFILVLFTQIYWHIGRLGGWPGKKVPAHFWMSALPMVETFWIRGM